MLYADLMDDLVLAITIALEATEIALAGFPSGQSPASELDEPLTTVDRKVEDFIVRQLCDRRPNDGVLGEEGTHIFSSNERRWLIGAGVLVVGGAWPRSVRSVVPRSGWL